MTETAGFENLHEKNGFDQEQALYILNTINTPMCIATDISCKEILHNRSATQFLRIEPWKNLSRASDVDPLVKLFYNGKELTSKEMPVQLAACEGKTVKGMEIEFRWHDGVRKCARVSANPIFDHDGKIVSAVATIEDITEQKKCEEELRSSEERFRALVETSSHVLYRMSSDWRIMFQFQSQNFLANTEEPNPNWLQDYIHPQDHPQFRAVIKEAIRTKSIFALEHRVRRADGSMGWTASRAVPLLNDAGEIVEWFGAARDITEHKLRQANLACMAEIAAVFAPTTDREIMAAMGQKLGTYLNVSSYYLIEIDEMQETGTINYIWSNDKQPDISGVHRLSSYVTEAVLEAARAGETIVVHNTQTDPRIHPQGYAAFNIHSYVTVPFHREGTWKYLFTVNDAAPRHWHEAETELIREVASRTFLLLERVRAETALQASHKELEQKVQERTAELDRVNRELHREIKGHKRTGKALLEQEQQYRSLVENANEAIVVIQDDYIKFANPAALEMFACTPGEIGTTPFSSFIHPQDQELIMQRRHKRLKGEKLKTAFTFRLVAADGSIKSIVKSSVAIKWEGRQAVLCMLTDITELRKMEEEIIKADKLDSIGILAGGIAHDFNNYLATLMGNISLAKLYQDEPAKIMEKLKGMEKATLRAKELSNQLFTFAKGGAPVKEELCLRQLIMDDINFTLSGSSVYPLFEVAAELHMVEADQGQFSQVLSNLTLNAVQAMPEGGSLKVQAQNVTLTEGDPAAMPPLAAGPYVKITIQDEGTGIPEKHLARIFDPFFTTKDKGRGLGLATAYSIIKKHGGHLGVESEMGVGSTFAIFLPATDKKAVAPETAATICTGKGRVLLMDDDESLRTVTAEQLASLGYELTTAGHGREAVELYREAMAAGRPHDLVILDLTIPGGMGGKQTMQELLKYDPGVKGIVASGYSNDPVMADCAAYGFKGSIKKPFTIAELSEVVWEMLSRETA